MNKYIAAKGITLHIKHNYPTGATAAGTVTAQCVGRVDAVGDNAVCAAASRFYVLCPDNNNTTTIAAAGCEPIILLPRATATSEKYTSGC